MVPVLQIYLENNQQSSSWSTEWSNADNLPEHCKLQTICSVPVHRALTGVAVNADTSLH